MQAGRAHFLLIQPKLMQLAIVHYHLNRGGVTQAVLNHLHALATLPADKRPSRVLLLHSGQHEGWPASVWPAGDPEPFEVRLAAVPALEYDSPIASCDPDALATAIEMALGSVGFDSIETVLQVHNHALGKNASLPGALRLLSQRGWRLLLQVHDFAEDFRPANYRHLMRATHSTSTEQLASTLYPAGEGIHYAVLNGRDHQVLSSAGANRLHTLPNPVLTPHGRPPREEARGRVMKQLRVDPDTRLVIYPVRGIRRKNVGEMLLHAALAGNGSCYAVTLAPTNPVEAPAFIRWQELAGELKLNCRFDIGGSEGVDFLDALAAADALITTSVAEGFGMVFLESWLAGCVLVGRDLPEITADFRAAGLVFECLAPRLLVPTSWIDADGVEAAVHELHRWTCQDYGLDTPIDGETMVATGEAIDFAALPAGCQRKVIRHVVADVEHARQAMNELNPSLEQQLTAVSDDHRAMIDANAEFVGTQYSPTAVGRRLADIYTALRQDTPRAKASALPNGRSILDYFLTLERLRPVRVES